MADLDEVLGRAGSHVLTLVLDPGLDHFAEGLLLDTCEEG